MITVDTITDVDLRGLLFSHTFQTETWNHAQAALDGNRDSREWCARRLNHFAESGATTAGYYPSLGGAR